MHKTEINCKTIKQNNGHASVLFANAQRKVDWAYICQKLSINFEKSLTIKYDVQKLRLPQTLLLGIMQLFVAFHAVGRLFDTFDYFGFLSEIQ